MSNYDRVDICLKNIIQKFQKKSKKFQEIKKKILAPSHFSLVLLFETLTKKNEKKSKKVLQFTLIFV